MRLREAVLASPRTGLGTVDRARFAEDVADVAVHMIFKHPDGMEEWMAFFEDCDGGLLALMSQVRPL